ncbi:MBL fold metallo-hydrolase [Halochromatium roseum]|uniref:MBL fold metallo-hydrolase n=1 Tax=Halochromatium roseum TaxID=391920 RepID=UPI001911B2C1|nr:MBL fold metallo-hydrolase [Halochromatium roseum]MBK5941928.1 MBL fold metallo-hydrolase [Halochromatium roseum]
MPTADSAAARYQAVADGVFCIETGLYRDGLAACYLIRERDRLAFVDTGTTKSMPGLLGVIKDLGLTPEHVDYVIPTHVHLDHAGGAGTLMAACPNATLITHPKGAPHLIDPAKLTAGASAVYGEDAFARDFGALAPVPEARVIAANDGQTFDLAGRQLRFIHTPGHANHHGCIFDEGSSGLFTGDTFGISYREFDTATGPWLFAPTTPVAFDPDAWQQSLDRMLAFEPVAAFLTHYCRIDAPARQVDQLRRSVRDLATIALEYADEPQPARKDRIKDAITAHLLSDARAHGCTLDEPHMRELLAVDLELNAQGLEVWLQRREKRDR